MTINHELKILPCYFKEVVAGNKTFEIRDNSDRGFQKGDVVKLEEYQEGSGIPGTLKGTYTDNRCLIKITYVTGAYQQPGFVVFGFKRIDDRGEVLK